MDELTIRPVQLHELAAARQLILEGLAEQWGFLDETRNPDLDDIPGYYAAGEFLVAQHAGRVVGTGALLPEGTDTGRIVRMSVDRAYRRQGIGRAILQALTAEARRRGYCRLVLETTATWTEAIAFYQAQGYRPVGEQLGDLHFIKHI
jgi:GNAT superfamily N-acetyltransferase